MKKNIMEHESLIWNIADTYRSIGILDGDVPRAMTPFFALMLVDSRMVRTTKFLREKLKEEGLSEKDIIEEIKEDMPYYNSMIIEENISLKDICKNDTNFYQNLNDYLNSYDEETKRLLGINPIKGESNYLNLEETIIKLKNKKVLFSIVKQWTSIPFEEYNNSEITTLEEHIKRKWADMSATTAGQHYTPSDVIDLIHEIIKKHLSLNKKEGYIKIYDPTCGGGNMLFGLEDQLRKSNPKLKIQSYGQDFSEKLYALAKIESRFREESFIELGDTLKEDKFENVKFDYIVANPPYGVKWLDQAVDIKERGENQGCYLDKYPSTSDGQLLFLQHILFKMKDDGYAIVVSNGSPLFSGDANSGESAIRKWILDNNYLDALIQLPKEEFFNTKITTYLWILNKNRTKDNKQIKIIDASNLFTKLSKSKGDKSVEINPEQKQKIVDMLFCDNNNITEPEICKVFDKEYFYYNKQEILIKNKDINGKSIEDILPVKKVKGIERRSQFLSIQNIKTIYSGNKKLIDLNKDGSINFYGIEQIDNESLKEKNTKIKKMLSEINDIKVETYDGNSYFYDKDKETIIMKNNNEIKELGNGKFKISSTYKPKTKNKDEWIQIKVELHPNHEKDIEIIPFQEKVNGKIVNVDIDTYLKKWVKKDFEKLNNTVGVEINFNKIFYKFKPLRPIMDIIQDLEDCIKQETELDKDLFNFEPIEIKD